MEGVIDQQLIWAVLGGVAALLILILAFKINAFVSLLISSIVVGIIAGIPLAEIVGTIKKGMGNTLGAVAVIIGLGAIFGEILRASGSTEKISRKLLGIFGVKHAPIALSLTGFIIAIPVFFDVAFIILIPMIYALQRQTNRSLLYYAIPLLASLAITHAFIPPTPGPIAVAEILGSELGLVILYGLVVGIPTAIVAGLVFGRYIAGKIDVKVPNDIAEEKGEEKHPHLGVVLGLIALPILLIVANTLTKAIYPEDAVTWIQVLQFMGHPVVALLLSTVIAWYILGNRMGFTKTQLQEMSMKALGPAGIIILITGAGGVFKEMLITTGAGEMLANRLAILSIGPLVLAYLLALLVRVIQGSATVAMITAAGIMAPIITGIELGSSQLALMVLIIAAGASGFSHVNDSGFWLVNRYLGMSELNTLKSWTAMTGILSVFSACLILLISVFL